MEIKPILFSTQMVQAILEGRKTQTRRIIKPYPTGSLGIVSPGLCLDSHLSLEKTASVKSKYSIGDVLWVRETWAPLVSGGPQGFNLYHFKADKDNNVNNKWKPSIFMPKEAARIFLKVTNIRAERLQDITQDDAIAEGINPLLMSRLQLTSQGQLYQNYLDNNKLFNDGLPPYWSFNSLWCKINGADSWESNPWVWVYEFEKVEKPIIF